MCGLWSSSAVKGHVLRFFFPASCLTSSAHSMCLYLGCGLSSYATKQHYHCQVRFSACSFISSVSVSECVGVSVCWGPSPFPHPISLSPAHPQSVWAVQRPDPCGPLHTGLPVASRYRWDLRLSLSASAARRRRKQDARGSTVISLCALFHTIPGPSLYSLLAGPPLDIYMCQKSHRYWPT